MKGNKISLASSALALVSVLVTLAVKADETVCVRPGDKTEVLLKSPSDDERVVRLKMPAGVVTNTADLVVRKRVRGNAEAWVSTLQLYGENQGDVADDGREGYRFMFVEDLVA